jgi:Protein of unknown function (DUF2950)
MLLVLTVGLAAGCKHKNPVGDFPSGQRAFASAEEAGGAVQTAVIAGDQDTLTQILGPASKDILSSGDPAEDKAALDKFAKKYDRMHRWVTMTDGTQMLYVGADNYPYPIPLKKNVSGQWYFDTAAARDEILARRIGKNELLAMDACNAIGNAEELYFKKVREGNPGRQYAALIISSEGKQDGLYWETPADQEESPLGRLKEFVKGDIRPSTANEPRVFDGYSYRILDAQGDQAKGGAKSYAVNGKMTGGWAVLASPVKYRDSGVMTFILSREGVVYQKDLGPQTVDLSASIKEYNPDQEWEPAQP